MKNKNKEKFTESALFPILFSVGIIVLMVILVAWQESSHSSTRPDDEDGEYLVVKSQIEKFIEFGEEEDCPIEFHLPDSRKRLIHSMGPENCLPIHTEPNYSSWKPGCFYYFNLVGVGLEYLLYSHKCIINVYTTDFGEGV